MSRFYFEKESACEQPMKRVLNLFRDLSEREGI